MQIWTSGRLTDNMGRWEFRRQIVGYYWSIWGSNIAVERTFYDADGVVTTSSSQAATVVYTVTVLKAIDGPSFTLASVVKEGATTSTITIATPYEQSTPPLSGAFYISCPNDDGTEFRTRDLGYGHWDQGIDFYVHLEIPHLQFKAYIRSTSKYSYRQNGIELMLVFQDYHGDVPQCTIHPSESNPLEGNDVIEYNAITYREYGQNLMFEPIPLEFMYTDATQPQVLVSVNGIDGVCPEFNCDFLYIEPAGLITSQVLTDGLDLTITGTSLPTEDIRVILANAECESITASETDITCTLSHYPAAGSWDVRVLDYRGLIPLADDADCIDVDLVVDSVTPNTDLNQLGGDLLTFVGTGFDAVTDDTTIVFGDETTCIVVSATDTELTCIVDGFDPAVLNTASPYSMAITVNEITNTDHTVQILSTKQSG